MDLEILFFGEFHDGEGIKDKKNGLQRVPPDLG
jgi:hypothetical protein